MGWREALAGPIGATMVALAAACAPPEPPRVQIDVADGLRACAGQRHHIESFVAEAFARLDRPMPDDFELTLHIVGPDAFAELDVCLPEAGGCAVEGEAWSVGHGAMLHELTHVVLRELAPQGLPALSEGIAESFGTPSPLSNEPTPRFPLESYSDKSSAELEGQEQIAAGLLTTFLLDHFGPQAYLDAYASLGPGDDLAAIDATFMENFGESLASVDAQFAEPTERRCMVALGFCGETLGAVVEPPFELQGSLACDEPGALGFSSTDGAQRPFRRISAEIPRTGRYRVVVEGTVVSALRCGSCEERRGPLYFNGTSPMSEPVELEAGRWVFEISELLDEHQTFRLAVEPVPG